MIQNPVEVKGAIKGLKYSHFKISFVTIDAAKKFLRTNELYHQYKKNKEGIVMEDEEGLTEVGNGIVEKKITLKYTCYQKKIIEIFKIGVGVIKI